MNMELMAPVEVLRQDSLACGVSYNILMLKFLFIVLAFVVDSAAVDNDLLSV